jgi:hypothetical protein
LVAMRQPTSTKTKSSNCAMPSTNFSGSKQMDYDAWLDRQLYEYDRERELAERDCQDEEEDLDSDLCSMFV